MTICNIRTLVLLLTLPAPATEYFSSPDASNSGDGSSERPFRLADALATSSRLLPGDTLLLKSGDYLSPNGYLFYCNLRGAQGMPITIRPAPGHNPVIKAGFYIQQSWIVLRDLEFTSPYTNRKTSQPGSFPADIQLADGVTSFAPNVKIINNIVHDLGSGINSWAAATENEIHGNVVYNNGFVGPDRGHGHGMYMQNRGAPKYISDNIVFHNYGIGMQLYGTSTAYIDNMVVEGNTIFNNGSPSGEKTRNILLGGTAVAINPVVRNNYTYYDTDDHTGGDNNVGYYSSGAGCTNLILQNNYFVSGLEALTLHRCSVSNLSGNTFFGLLRNWNPLDHPANTYLNYTRPQDARVFVRPNRYESGRSHVTVFNWPRSATVSVDLSGTGLSIGDSFEVRDVQNKSGSPVHSGIFNGAPIALVQNLAAITPLQGNAPIPVRHTASEFNVFVVRRIGADTLPPQPAPPPVPPSAPFAIQNLTVTGITQNTALIQWSTTAGASSQVLFGPTPSYGLASTPLNLGTTVHATLLTGLTPATDYFIRAVSTSGSATAAATGSFRTQSAPAPPPPPGTSGPVLKVGVAAVPAGGTITVEWTAPAVRGLADWLGLYAVGAHDREYRWYSLTRGAAGGTITVSIPKGVSGQFEFRYLINNQYQSVAKSSPFTITGK